MTQNIGGNGSSSHWRAEHFRTTSFFLPGVGPDAREHWWTAVVGSQPDEERHRPQEGLTQQIGRSGDNALAVEWRPERVDWRLVPPIITPSQPQIDFPSVGTLPDALEPFLELSRRGLEQCTAVNRLAFGMVLLVPVDSNTAAHAELQKYLSTIQFQLDDSVDFFYQINRPRMSKTAEGVAINRLTKWSVAVSGSISISLTPGSGLLVPDPNPHFAARLELDINTAPSGSLIPVDLVTSLFGELAQLGTEIAEKGDVP